MSAPLAPRHSARRAEAGADSVSSLGAELAGGGRGGRGRPRAIAPVAAPGAVEALDDVRERPGVAPAPGTRRELEGDLLHPHGVVGGHAPRVVEGADPV